MDLKLGKLLGRLIPGFGTAATASLVIRSGSVELLEVKSRKVGIRLSVPLEGKDAGSLAAAIQKACSGSGLSTKKLAVSILSQDVLLRFFMIPVVPRGEWDSAVQFEARKYIPFKTDELVWDAHVAASKTAGKLDVIFAAIKRETFTAVEASLNRGGMQPRLIEPRSMSLARLTASGAGQPTEDFVCIVDVESASAHLTIARGGVPYLARDMSFASAPDPEPPAPGAGKEMTDPRAQRLLSELSVSVDFFTREYSSAGITKIWLVGEESLIAPWCGWLADQLRCPVELGTPLLAKFLDDRVPLAFASAVGVVAAVKSRHGSSLDFLKRATGKAATPAVSIAKVSPNLSGFIATVKTPQAAVVACALAAALLGVWFFGGGRVEAKRRELQQLTRSAPQVGWAIDGMTLEALQPMVTSIDGQLTLLKQLIDRRVSIAGKMDSLARSLPDGIWLTGLTFEDRSDGVPGQQVRAVVKGACFLGEDGPELRAIQELEHRIRQNARFFEGFKASRLEEIAAQKDYQREYTYRIFQLKCSSEQRL